MQWVFGFLLWWTFDDHLATATEMPRLGELPWWVVLLAAFALHLVCASDTIEQIRRTRRSKTR